MKKFIKKISQTSLFSSIILIIFGVSLIMQVETTMVTISYILGGILCLIGTLAAIKYIRSANKIEKSELDIVYSTVCIILGILIIKNPLAIQNTILFVVGLIILINSATKLQSGLELRKSKSDIFIPTICISIIMAVCGIFLMFRPDIATDLLGKVVGTLIVIYAILDLVTSIIIKNTFKKMGNKEIKEAKIEEIEDKKD